MNVVSTERAHAVLSAADRATGAKNADGVGDVARVDSSVDVQAARATASVRKTLI